MTDCKVIELSAVRARRETTNPAKPEETLFAATANIWSMPAEAATIGDLLTLQLGYLRLHLTDTLDDTSLGDCRAACANIAGRSASMSPSGRHQLSQLSSVYGRTVAAKERLLAALARLAVALAVPPPRRSRGGESPTVATLAAEQRAEARTAAAMFRRSREMLAG